MSKLLKIEDCNSIISKITNQFITLSESSVDLHDASTKLLVDYQEPELLSQLSKLDMKAFTINKLASYISDELLSYLAYDDNVAEQILVKNDKNNLSNLEKVASSSIITGSTIAIVSADFAEELIQNDFCQDSKSNPNPYVKKIRRIDDDSNSLTKRLYAKYVVETAYTDQDFVIIVDNYQLSDQVVFLRSTELLAEITTRENSDSSTRLSMNVKIDKDYVRATMKF